MAISWGSWAGPSGQRLRVGIDLSVSGTTITAKYYIEAESSMNDNQTMTLTGASTGTVTYTANTPQSGGTQLVTTKTKSGTRGSKYTFEAKVTGVYTGASPSESASITVPAAPPAKPSTPSVSSVKSSSFKATLGSAPSTNGASITGYVFQISTASDFTAGLSTISTGASTLSATFTGLAANTGYWVRVKATSGAGDSSYSSGRAVTTTPNAPAAPTSPTVTRVSDTTQNVGWSRAATSAAPYVNQYVERRDNVATAWIRASGALAGTATAFTDTTTVANRRYDYRVVAENAGGIGTSAVVSINTTPAAPTGVTAVKVGTTIEVSWTRTATQAGITAHEVWDKPAGGVGVLVATVAGTATAWTDATPDTAKTHQYYVVARAGTLASAASTPSNVVQLLAPPLAPSRVGPTGAVDRAKAVLFAWKHEAVDTTAQSAYELQYRVNGGSWVVLTGTTAQTRSVTALGVSGTLEWQVRTKGQHASFGPWSAVWTFTLASQPTVLVSTPSGVYGSSRVTVVWAYANVDPSGQAQFEAELVRDGLTLEVKSGDSSAGTVSFGFSLVDREAYLVRVRVRSASGLWSDWAESEFTTDFPLPVTVEPIPVFDPATGAVTVTFTDPPMPSTYEWTGPPNASPSTSDTADGTVTNFEVNPRFATDADTPPDSTREPHTLLPVGSYALVIPDAPSGFGYGSFAYDPFGE
ncbi:fibronectin type III domain-containing protein [Timonella senegalensis]|uniref:fibronectin type III domain-containing protein n=1 Tax=Timonella senegalensis TaxID=1465825 RepID=UPI0028B10969|nr:fibronectin type III domain-containing protein [Timonella senegalensis]